MEILLRSFDLEQTVQLTTFSAAEHTILKETISDTRTGSRIYYRLHLDARAFAKLPPKRQLQCSKSYTKLGDLCAAFDIDPALAGNPPANAPHGPVTTSTHQTLSHHA